MKQFMNLLLASKSLSLLMIRDLDKSGQFGAPCIEACGNGSQRGGCGSRFSDGRQIIYYINVCSNFSGVTWLNQPLLRVRCPPISPLAPFPYSKIY